MWVQLLLLLVNLYALLPSHQVLSDFVGYRVHSGTMHRVVGVRFACVCTSRTTVHTSAAVRSTIVSTCGSQCFALIFSALPVAGRCVALYLYNHYAATTLTCTAPNVAVASPAPERDGHLLSFVALVARLPGPAAGSHNLHLCACRKMRSLETGNHTCENCRGTRSRSGDHNEGTRRLV